MNNKQNMTDHNKSRIDAINLTEHCKIIEVANKIYFYKYSEIENEFKLEKQADLSTGMTKDKFLSIAEEVVNRLYK